MYWHMKPRRKKLKIMDIKCEPTRLKNSSKNRTSSTRFIFFWVI